MKLSTMLGAMALAMMLAACGSPETNGAGATPVVTDPNATASAKLHLDTAPD